VITDAAPVHPPVLDEPARQPGTTSNAYANNRIEPDHSRLKHRPRPMRGQRTDRTARVIITGLAFVQDLRRGHGELATQGTRSLRVAAAFTELASTN
jgi:transposase-like protein